MTTTDSEIDELVRRLGTVGKEVMQQIDDKKNPSIAILTRALNNVYFDKEQGLIKLGDKTQRRYYFNLNQAKKFMQTLLVAKQIKWLLEQRKPALSTRQLYYTLKHSIPNSKENTFDSQQKETDPIIEDIEVVVDALREQLKLIATPKGVLAGNIIVKDQNGDMLDFSRMGSAGGAVPPIVEKYAFDIKECKADFILVV
ncbi:MAG: DNA topoisomerase IV subunit A, partial [Candidatus Aenigmarchaeota archaeon]|nr:DNA topoisomerase IV subunit A [Candidatus Aenigmarchaeota archaeon]